MTVPIEKYLINEYGLPDQQENEKMQDENPSSISFWQCPTCQACIIHYIDYCPDCTEKK